MLENASISAGLSLVEPRGIEPLTSAVRLLGTLAFLRIPAPERQGTGGDSKVNAPRTSSKFTAEIPHAKRATYPRERTAALTNAKGSSHG